MLCRSVYTYLKGYSFLYARVYVECFFVERKIYIYRCFDCGCAFGGKKKNEYKICTS